MTIDVHIGDYLKAEQSTKARKTLAAAETALNDAVSANRPTSEIEKARKELLKAQKAIPNVEDRTIKSDADEKSVEGLEETVADLHKFLSQLSDHERTKLPVITVRCEPLKVTAKGSSVSSASDLTTSPRGKGRKQATAESKDAQG